MEYGFLVAGAVLCATLAIRARQLIATALWLAGTSALVAFALYLLGAHEVAVIELSVGAGLVTVLFVFAISIAGDDALSKREFTPNALAVGAVVVICVLLAWLALPLEARTVSGDERAFAEVLWSDRALDVLVQLVLIFTGVLCVLGLLRERTPAAHGNAVRGTQAALTRPSPAQPDAPEPVTAKERV